MPEETRAQLLQLIQQLKQQYGEPLYGTLIGENFYIFRPLGPAEFGGLVNSGLFDAEHICAAAVVWPEIKDWSRVTAADPDHLADLILNLSGFGDSQYPYRLFQHYQSEMESWKAQAEAIIMEAFPSLRPDEVPKLPVDTFLWYLSRALWILKNLRGVPIEFNVEMPKEEKDSAGQVKQLREQGIDPMLALYAPEPRDRNWVEIPFIIGSRWQTVDPRRSDEDWQNTDTSQSTPQS